jgi:hypothetical protein
MTSSPKSADQPLANEAGVELPAVQDADPYRALDDLMAVVEALCPEWPQRPALLKTDRMLL